MGGWDLYGIKDVRGVIMVARLVVFVSVLAACGVLAQGFGGTTFFGEDLNPGATVPSGSAPETQFNAFQAALPGAGVEDLESYSSMPTQITFPLSSGDVIADFSSTARTPGTSVPKRSPPT